MSDIQFDEPPEQVWETDEWHVNQREADDYRDEGEDLDDEDDEYEEIDYTDPYYEAMGYMADGTRFASEGSALRAAMPDNPRNRPCPTCGRENVLTPADVARHYQCDACADQAEAGY